MKIDQADKVFSEFIRSRDNWTCQRCHKYYDEENRRGLHCSHFFGRANESTRFEPDNCTALCYGCHKFFDEKDREAYREFKLKQIGKERFENLIIKARSHKKRDRQESLLESKQLLQSLTI